MWITLKTLFTGGIRLSQLSGPVGIYSIVGEQRSAGVANVIYLIAFLNLHFLLLKFFYLFAIHYFDFLLS